MDALKDIDDDASSITLAGVMYTWAEHSDCDGVYYSEECDDLITLLEHYLLRFKELGEDYLVI